MVAPYTAQVTQNANKCPHGLPMGTCPICSNMGGGSVRKDRDTPRRAGEMTYNECMAAWIKIQAAQDAKLQAKIDRIELMQAMKLKSTIEAMHSAIQKAFDKINQTIKNFPPIIKAPIKFVVKVVVQIANLIAKIPTLINNIKTFISNLSQMITSTSEKMAMVLGEVKNFIDSKVVAQAKKAIKTLLSLFTENEEDDEQKEKVEKTKAQELKKVLKGLFRIKNKDQQKEEKEDEY